MHTSWTPREGKLCTTNPHIFIFLFSISLFAIDNCICQRRTMHTPSTIFTRSDSTCYRGRAFQGFEPLRSLASQSLRSVAAGGTVRVYRCLRYQCHARIHAAWQHFTRRTAHELPITTNRRGLSDTLPKDTKHATAGSEKPDP